MFENSLGFPFFHALEIVVGWHVANSLDAGRFVFEIDTEDGIGKHLRF